MADIDLKQILSDCISFARIETGSSWKKIKPFAEHEFTQFIKNILFLAELKLSGVIEVEEFSSRLQLQKIAIAQSFVAIKGMGISDVQEIVKQVEKIIFVGISKELNIVLPA